MESRGSDRERISRRLLTVMGATVLGQRLAGGNPAGRSALAAPLSSGSLSAATPVPSAGPDQGALWVQPPNHGGAGRLAPDFFEMFTTRGDEWVEARGFVAIWVVRMTSLLGQDAPLGDTFLGESFLPKLREWGIALAVNVAGATHAQCAVHTRRIDAQTTAIQRLLDLGADISFLSLQSPLSKVSGSCPAYGKETGYDLRIADVVRYLAIMTERFPGIEIGLVDAMPAKGWAYQDVYRRLLDALTACRLKLAFIHLDFPMESASLGWANVREARISYAASSEFCSAPLRLQDRWRDLQRRFPRPCSGRLPRLPRRGRAPGSPRADMLVCFPDRQSP